MDNTIIKVGSVGKKYIISHRGSERYTALRDVISRKTKGLLKRKENQAPAREEFWALQDISFEIKQGDAVGIIGRNGAGKSTLLKILSRITEPTTGRIEINGRVASLLEVGTGFHPELTGRENVFLNGAILGMSQIEIRRKFDEIVDFSGVEKFLDTPVKRYSSGMYVRLAFAVAAHLEPEILVVDEVLAVGDAEFQKKCIGKMDDVSKSGRTVLFVSHNMGSILDLCKKGIYLENGRMKFMGDIQSTVNDYLNAKVENRAVFTKYLKYVEVKQEYENIVVTAEYDSETELDIPHLGFVIKNSMGAPVTGSNPTTDNIALGGAFNKKKGRIRVLLKQPKLTDGNYNVTVYFGDSKENFVFGPDCLSFEVAGMTSQKPFSSQIVGNCLPVCEWQFSS